MVGIGVSVGVNVGVGVLVGMGVGLFVGVMAFVGLGVLLGFGVGVGDGGEEVFFTQILMWELSPPLSKLIKSVVRLSLNRGPQEPCPEGGSDTPFIDQGFSPFFGSLSNISAESKTT
ncbi:hypothetical protein A3A46_02630 [Candidatus Roizmanbacteria bacterium RIFCSPLOWO2_01_FULL_37_13]|nr:MAG: hypothetical protein A3A46_02630 [Candidatus Roizmanbacteria bacterium RIFCSPLOWO2_01_FULL_37_13]